MADTNSHSLPPLITLEEHFLSTSYLASNPSDVYSQQLEHIPGLLDKLTDLDQTRIESMDSNDISLQVISHGPTQPTLTPDTARATNLQLHAALVAHPTRLAGFAALPMANPDAAAKELAFCVEELGFVGALIDSHTADGTTYHTAEYTGFWYTVQSLGVPVYIHPTWATQAQRSALFHASPSASLPSAFLDSIASSSWGWHSDIAVHFFTLFAAGIFDRFPRLKIILGHFGEMIPFMLGRISQLSTRWGARQRTFRQVWDENVWITTSGVWGLDPLRCILSPGNTRRDRILFSIDYPFARNEDGKKFMLELRDSALVDDEGLRMIGYRNAEKLLGIRVRRKDEEKDRAQVEDEEEEQEHLDVTIVQVS